MRKRLNEKQISGESISDMYDSIISFIQNLSGYENGKNEVLLELRALEIDTLDMIKKDFHHDRYNDIKNRFAKVSNQIQIEANRYGTICGIKTIRRKIRSFLSNYLDSEKNENDKSRKKKVTLLEKELIGIDDLISKNKIDIAKKAALSLEKSLNGPKSALITGFTVKPNDQKVIISNAIEIIRQIVLIADNHPIDTQFFPPESIKTLEKLYIQYSTMNSRSQTPPPKSKMRDIPQANAKISPSNIKSPPMPQPLKKSLTPRPTVNRIPISKPSQPRSIVSEKSTPKKANVVDNSIKIAEQTNKGSIIHKNAIKSAIEPIKVVPESNPLRAHHSRSQSLNNSSLNGMILPLHLTSIQIPDINTLAGNPFNSTPGLPQSLRLIKSFEDVLPEIPSQIPLPKLINSLKSLSAILEKNNDKETINEIKDIKSTCSLVDQQLQKLSTYDIKSALNIDLLKIKSLISENHESQILDLLARRIRSIMKTNEIIGDEASGQMLHNIVVQLSELLLFFDMKKADMEPKLQSLIRENEILKTELIETRRHLSLVNESRSDPYGMPESRIGSLSNKELILSYRLVSSDLYRLKIQEEDRIKEASDRIKLEEQNRSKLLKNLSHLQDRIIRIRKTLGSCDEKGEVFIDGRKYSKKEVEQKENELLSRQSNIISELLVMNQQ